MFLITLFAFGLFASIQSFQIEDYKKYDRCGPNKECLSDSIDVSVVEMEDDYVFDAAMKFPTKMLTPPSNNENSIQYLLYTPKNKKEPYLIEQSAEKFDKSPFEKSYDTKFLIHGLKEMLTEDNLLNSLKDTILEHHDYNVIVVNWTLYNGEPFEMAYEYAKPVGEKVAEMMKFIKNHAKEPLKTMHCIGHSLGAHVCGVAGRNAHSLARITGLDPGGISVSKRLTPNIRLRYSDADFVDVMHTSDIFSDTGLGYLDPIAHFDFYPNGGVAQPHCVQGNKYTVFRGNSRKIHTPIDTKYCNHFITIHYFANSLKDDCKFVATQCQSYSDFEKGKCSSNIKTNMGFYTKKIEGVPPMTEFYLNTLASPPYCKE